MAFTLKVVTGCDFSYRTSLDTVQRGGGLRTDRLSGGLLRTESEQPTLK